MALRAVCEYAGKRIGTESLYMYSDVSREPVYIEKNLSFLREKSNAGELYCPCGCKTPLVLAAGAKMEAHFRRKDGYSDAMCKFSWESTESLRARILLNGWLNRVLPGMWQTRYLYHPAGRMDQLCELPFFSKQLHLAIVYVPCATGYYASDALKKLADALQRDSIKALFLTNDSATALRIGDHILQELQGFILSFSYNRLSYKDSALRVYYVQPDRSVDCVISGRLTDFAFDANRDLTCAGNRVLDCVDDFKKDFQERLEQIRQLHKETQKTRRIWQERARSAVSHTAPAAGDSGSLIRPQKAHTSLSTAGQSNLYTCKYCGRKGTRDDFASFNVSGDTGDSICNHCASGHQLMEENRHVDSLCCPRCGKDLFLRGYRSYRFSYRICFNCGYKEYFKKEEV